MTIYNTVYTLANPGIHNDLEFYEYMLTDSRINKMSIVIVKMLDDFIWIISSHKSINMDDIGPFNSWDQAVVFVTLMNDHV